MKGYARIAHVIITEFSPADEFGDCPPLNVATVTARLEALPDVAFNRVCDSGEYEKLTKRDSDFYLRHGGSVALVLETLCAQADEDGGIFEWLEDQEGEPGYHSWFCEVPELDDDFRYVRWKLYGEPEPPRHFISGGLTASSVYDYGNLCRMEENGRVFRSDSSNRAAARFKTAHRNTMLPPHFPPFF